VKSQSHARVGGPGEIQLRIAPVHRITHRCWGRGTKVTPLRGVVVASSRVSYRTGTVSSAVPGLLDPEPTQLLSRIRRNTDSNTGYPLAVIYPSWMSDRGTLPLTASSHAGSMGAHVQRGGVSTSCKRVCS